MSHRETAGRHCLAESIAPFAPPSASTHPTTDSSRPTPARRRAALGRSLLALAVLIGVLLATTTPAGADPARPTDYRSRILSIRPTLPDGVDLRVIGGDAFLDLQVSGDHTVVVPDYTSGTGTVPRPYLRFRPDGTVERNDHSAAAAANETRYGTSRGGEIGDEPAWTVVSRDGRYVWHDHRIHWMLPRAPTAVDDDGRVDLGGSDGTWTVQLVVDDRMAVVRGELLLLDAPSPVPWLVLAVVLVAAMVTLSLAAVRAGVPPHRAIAGTLAVAGALATAAGWAQWQAIPPGAGGSVLTALVPAVGTVAALVALTVSSAPVRLVGLALGAATLGGWAVLRREALWRAVLPTSLPFAFDRAATAIALGVALGTAAMLVWRPPVKRRTTRPGRLTADPTA